MHSPWLACFSLQDSNVRLCSKKWRKERAVAEIERFLSKIARGWIILFSQHSDYLSSLTQVTQETLVHYLPVQTWWYRTVTQSELRRYQHRQPRQNRVDQHGPSIFIHDILQLCRHLDTETYGKLPCQFCNFTCEITNYRWNFAPKLRSNSSPMILWGKTSF